MLRVCVKLAGKGGKTTICRRKNCDKNRLQLLRCYERYTGGWWRTFPSFSISFWSSISILALKSFILHFNFHNIPIYEEMVFHRFSVTQSLEARSIKVPHAGLRDYACIIAPVTGFWETMLQISPEIHDWPFHLSFIIQQMIFGDPKSRL